MSRARLLRVAVLALLSAAALHAQPVPALTGRVVDTAGILSADTEAVLTSRLVALEGSSTAQVAVLTIPSLRGAVLEEYATRVFRTWGLGQADRDNGVLLLISRDDRQLRIEVGYGLEGDLTDARAATIIRSEIVPRFRDGDFDAGVVAGVEAIAGSVEGTYQVPAPRPPSGGLWLFMIVMGWMPFIPVWTVLHTGPDGTLRTVLAGLFALLPGIGIGLPLAVAFRSVAALAPVVLLPLLAVGLDLWIERHPVRGPARRARRRRAAAIREARRRGATSVVVDGVSYPVPTYSSSDGSSGGGFSGGGGSSGGGGASGGW